MSSSPVIRKGRRTVPLSELREQADILVIVKHTGEPDGLTCSVGILPGFERVLSNLSDEGFAAIRDLVIKSVSDGMAKFSGRAIQ